MFWWVCIMAKGAFTSLVESGTNLRGLQCWCSEELATAWYAPNFELFVFNHMWNTNRIPASMVISSSLWHIYALLHLHGNHQYWPINEGSDSTQKVVPEWGQGLWVTLKYTWVHPRLMGTHPLMLHNKQHPTDRSPRKSCLFHLNISHLHKQMLSCFWPSFNVFPNAAKHLLSAPTSLQYALCLGNKELCNNHMVQ